MSVIEIILIARNHGVNGRANHFICDGICDKARCAFSERKPGCWIATGKLERTVRGGIPCAF